MTFEVSRDDYLRKVVEDRAALLLALKKTIPLLQAAQRSKLLVEALTAIAKAETP